MNDLLTAGLVVLVLIWLLAAAGVLYSWSNAKERDKRDRQWLKALNAEPRHVAWVRRDTVGWVTHWMPTYYGEDEATVRRCAKAEYPSEMFDMIVLDNNEYPEPGR